MKKIAILLISAAVTSAASVVGFSILHSAPEEFLITADNVTMSHWRMERATYEGRPVTKITIGHCEISGLHLSPLGVSADSFRAENLVIYATYVEGTVHGIKSGWAGDDVPSRALELLLPSQENAVQEKVTMRVLYQKAGSMRLSGVVIESPLDQPSVVEQDYSRMVGWDFRGPVSYKTADVTEITVSRIEGPLSLRWKNWEQTAASTVQRGVLVYSTHTEGGYGGMSFAWRGDQSPPNLQAVPDPCVMRGVLIRPVRIEAPEIELTDVELRIS